MVQNTIFDQLMYSTVRLTNSAGGMGTGFIYEYQNGTLKVPTIVTNKHVFEGNFTQNIKFQLHLSKNDFEPDLGCVNVDLAVLWIQHTTHDLCFCYLQPIIEEIKKKFPLGVYYKAISKALIPSEEQLSQLNAVEDIIMVGYPNGLQNETYVLPLFRKGVTSSHPKYDFNLVGTGLADIASFKGSSGSPIFIYNEFGYRDITGNLHLGESRFLFLGILYKGEPWVSRGQLVESKKELSLAFDPIMMQFINLGYYIKSSMLYEFEHIIESRLRSDNKI